MHGRPLAVDVLVQDDAARHIGPVVAAPVPQLAGGHGQQLDAVVHGLREVVRHARDDAGNGVLVVEIVVRDHARRLDVEDAASGEEQRGREDRADRLLRDHLVLLLRT